MSQKNINPAYSDPLIQERIRKINDIRELGIQPYAKDKFINSSNSVTITENAKISDKKNEIRNIKEIQEKANVNISIAGRLVLYRSMGKLAFGQIQDEYGRLQICFQKDQFTIEGLDEEKKSPAKFIEKLVDLGDFIGVSGEIFKTNHGELTLFVKNVRFLSKALRPMPEKFHGVKDRETLYRERNLDLMTNQESMNRFKLRSKMVEKIRNFYQNNGFLEVETPILQPQAGGAMAKTFNTHHNALDHDFVLRIAPELDLKRVIGGGMEKIFEIGKDFRNEGTDPSHLQEFTMLEWYGAYMDINDNKELIEEMIHMLCRDVFKKDIFTVRDTEGNETTINFGEKFENKRFPDLIKEYTGLDMITASLEEIQETAKNLEIETDGIGRGNLLDDIYKKTARPKLIQPTFVYDYPEELKPLAAPNGDGTASCYQLVVNSWEIVNAYGELIDPQIQRKLLEDQSDAKAGGDDEAMEIDEVFLKAMEHGFPSMTGCGFGIDRLAAIFTGMPNLRDVVLFPTMKPESKQVSKKEEYKIAVVILNEEANLEKWQEMNTVAHLNAAFGARHQTPKNLFKQDEITTSDKEKIKLNIQHAIMIKKADSNNEMKNIIDIARKNNIEISEFTREMIETTDDTLIISQAKTQKHADIEHLGLLLFGDKKLIESITKKYELFS